MTSWVPYWTSLGGDPGNGVIVLKAIGSHFLQNLSICREFFAESDDTGFVENFIIDFEKIRAKECAHKTGNVPTMFQLSLTDVPTFVLERDYLSL